jgi:hypothetical protein
MTGYGTFRTSINLRLESAFGGIAEVGLRGRQVSFWTQSRLGGRGKTSAGEVTGSYFSHSLRGTACRSGQSIVPV